MTTSPRFRCVAGRFFRTVSALTLCIACASSDVASAAAPTTAPAPAVPATLPATTGMVLIPGGTFLMGTDDGFPYEGPVHQVTVGPFFMDTHEVTIGDFAKFVKATGYKTEAEQFGWSGVFDPKQQEWTKADGAYWNQPEGPNGAKPDEREPVVHISFADAQAYAKWAGKRLPTEAEYEFAARGGLDRNVYAWGNEFTPGGKHMTNAWQGIFPKRDMALDRFPGRAPVGSFPANGYGLYDITGNVWEWTSDWFGPDYYRQSPADNPKGPEAGEEKSIRGGSWLCSDNYCVGYRVASRQKTAVDSGLNNLGFRCVRDATPAEVAAAKAATSQPAR